jgi:hypothetical protein
LKRSDVHSNWRTMMTNREDVLSDFTIEPEMSPAVLKTYLKKYPEFADELLDLFHELTMSDMEAVEASLPLETKAMTTSVLRVQKVEQALYGADVRELSKSLGLPRSFLMGLQASVVHIGSMPISLLNKLAKLLDVRLQDVISGMQIGDQQAVAMKSDVKPEGQPAIEFEDYVNQAGLTEEEQRALQELLADDGSD